MADEVAIRFAANIVGWKSKLQADEWYFVTLCDEMVASLSPAEAFDQIGGVVELVLNQNVGYLCLRAVALLLALARKSNTTELHPRLRLSWEPLIVHLASFGGNIQDHADELTSWYRHRTKE